MPSFNIYNGNEPVAYELQVIRARSCLVSAHNVGMDQTKAVIKPNFETWEQICKLKKVSSSIPRVKTLGMDTKTNKPIRN